MVRAKGLCFCGNGELVFSIRVDTREVFVECLECLFAFLGNGGVTQGRVVFTVDVDWEYREATLEEVMAAGRENEIWYPESGESHLE